MNEETFLLKGDSFSLRAISREDRPTAHLTCKTTSILELGAGQCVLKGLRMVRNKNKNKNYLVLLHYYYYYYCLSSQKEAPGRPACSTYMPHHVTRFDTGHMCPSQRRRLQSQQTNAKRDILIVPNNILSRCQKLLCCTFATGITRQIVTPVLACVNLQDSSSKVVPRRRISHVYRPTASPGKTLLPPC